MYLKVTNTEEWTYEGDQIKELSFTPEYDPTLNTYPIGEYEATIYDDQRSADDLCYASVDLYGIQPTSSSDYNSLLAGRYRINEVKEIGINLYKIKAQSILAELDKIRLQGQYYNGVTIDSFITEIFTDAGYLIDQPWYIWPVMSGYSVTGYCPEQTARERLVWVAQAYGASILQWGEYSRYGLCIAKAIDARGDSDYASYSTEQLQYVDTYKKPEVKEKQKPGKYSVTRYYSWSYDRPSSGGWGNVIVDYEYDLDTGERTPVYLYYFTDRTTITNPNASSKNEISVSGNMVINSTIYMAYLARAYFRDKTAELDMLIGDRDFQKYMPGKKVNFYADQTTMYCGVIRSANFIFGKLARVKLVIDVDKDPIALAHCRFNYRYVDGNTTRALGHRDYYIKPYLYETVNHPTFKSYVVDRWETFTPQTASSTIYLGLDQDITITIDYDRT